ncbi:fimbrial protein [Providencia rettgeri]|nr:type 1 fimbrial protein [Providencia rettgeri]ELR5233773.1 type 1 fimbrial protein [Providencia rettgeri]
MYIEENKVLTYLFGIRKFVPILLIYFCGSFSTFGEKEIGVRHEGTTQMIGSVIATPCSIMMKDRFQTVNFSSLALNLLSTKVSREEHNQPFEIELNNCGSLFSSLDSKTWMIRFDGNRASQINAFVLQGPSEGLGISVLDNTMQTLTPGESYSLFGNVLRQGKSGQTLVLRYFLQLELTGKPLQAGRYQGLIRFFIDYQ